jgi:uncharacterized protein YciI
MHYLLIYDLSPDYLEKREVHRDDHLDLAWKAQESGELVLGGALQDPADQAYLLFKSDSPEAAEGFAREDPYVKNGIVVSWKVRPWMTVVGDDSAKKVFPAGK